MNNADTTETTTTEEESWNMVEKGALSTDTIAKVYTNTIKASVLLDLLLGVSVATGKDDSLPVLTGIFLECEGGRLIATATDRYRLISGSTTYDGADFEGVLISPRTWAKWIVALKAAVKEHKYAPDLPATLSIDSFTCMESSIRVELLGDTFPKYGYLFPADTKPVEAIGLDGVLLAEIVKLNKLFNGKKAPTYFKFHGENKPVTVEVSHDSIQFRALIMPMRDNRG